LCSHEFFQTLSPAAYDLSARTSSWVPSSGREPRSSGIYQFRSQHCTANHIQTVSVQPPARVYALPWRTPRLIEQTPDCRPPGLSVLPVELLRPTIHSWQPRIISSPLTLP